MLAASVSSFERQQELSERLAAERQLKIWADPEGDSAANLLLFVDSTE
jgi:hypothetical protein